MAINSTDFELPEGCRFSEELGFDLVFQETKVRGSKNVLCQIQVTEVGDGVDLIEVYDFASWEGMKKEYPTLMHLLVEITHNVKWSAGWRENDRIFFIASMIGNEGLYDNKDTVWFDAIDGEPVLETEKPEMKVKKRKMK